MLNPREEQDLVRIIYELGRERLTPYDPIREREASLTRPVTPGAAVAEPLLSLAELRERLAGTPGAAIVVSDLHGQFELLNHVLTELGLVHGGERTSRRHTLISIGDLIDGRSEDDERCLQWGVKVFDRIVAGNHEVAFMGSIRFKGQPRSDRSNLGAQLYDAARQGILVSHATFQDLLLTHAGVSGYHAGTRSLAEVDELLADAWSVFLKRARSPEIGVLTGPSPVRGGTARRRAGVFWQDWSELLKDHPPQFRQIVGHTSRGRLERSLDQNLYNIDVTGYRLGVALITPSGEVSVGSDFLPPAL